jgi:hypothetical protein
LGAETVAEAARNLLIERLDQIERKVQRNRPRPR